MICDILRQFQVNTQSNSNRATDFMSKPLNIIVFWKSWAILGDTANSWKTETTQSDRKKKI